MYFAKFVTHVYKANINRGEQKLLKHYGVFCFRSFCNRTNQILALGKKTSKNSNIVL